MMLGSQINARDRKLLRKIRRWREKRAVNKDQRRIRRWVVFLGLLIVSAGVIYTVIGQHWITPASLPSDSVAIAVPEKYDLQSTQKTISEAPLAVSAQIMEVTPTSSTVNAVPTSPAEEGPPDSELGSPAAPAKSDTIHIFALNTCEAVVGRKCRAIQSTFSIQSCPKPHVWMDVRSDGDLPYTLRHVYYHDGHKYCEVPLTISHVRMRTWSYVSLNVKDHLGHWRVEVVADNEEILGQIKFKVTR